MDAYRAAILKDIGIDRYVIRRASSTAEPSVVDGSSTVDDAAAPRSVAIAPIASLSSRRPAQEKPSASRAQTSPLGTEVSATPRERTPQTPTSRVEGTVGLTRDRDYDALSLQDLTRVVAACEKCELSKARSQTVFGCGPNQVDLMLIGEAPTAEDEAHGQPFEGKAGQLLTKMLASVGIERQSIFLTNILKCKTPGNRDPLNSELAACGGFILRQIELLKPKLVVCVGRIAAQTVLASDKPLNQLRGQMLSVPELNIPVIVTFHPNYLLRAPREKAKAWQDLKQIEAMLARASLD